MESLELKLHPPVIFILHVLAMWGVAELVPSLTYHIPGSKIVIMLILMGAAYFGISGILSFRKAVTTIDPHKPEATRTLVTTGVYSLSRNPMYLGLLLGLIAWSIYLGNIISAVFLITFVLVVARLQIMPEERILTENFGEEYIDYRENVRRWI